MEKIPTPLARSKPSPFLTRQSQQKGLAQPSPEIYWTKLLLTQRASKKIDQGTVSAAPLPFCDTIKKINDILTSDLYTEDEKKELINKEIDAGAAAFYFQNDLNIKNILSAACQALDIRLVDLALQYGADITRQINLNRLIIQAAHNEHPDALAILKKILDSQKGKENFINRPGDEESGETPLHIAAQNQKPAIAQLLVEAKADPNLPDRDRETPFSRAIGSDIAQNLLKAFGGDSPSESNSGNSGNPVEVLKYFLTAAELQTVKEKLLKPGKTRKNPLWKACALKNIKAVLLLLQNGAEPSIILHGDSCLLKLLRDTKSKASDPAVFAILKALLHPVFFKSEKDRQNLIQYKDKAGNTASAYAAKHEKTDIVELLALNAEEYTRRFKDADYSRLT